MFKTCFSQKSSILNVTILFAVLLLLLYPGGAAQAADFTASTFAELSSAITTANGNGQADTITLTANITLSAALPQVASQITIEGAGYTLDGASTYRVLDVDSGGDLTVNNLTIQNGLSTNNGGAGIYNIGTLTVNYSTFTSNSATTTNPFGGAIYNNSGGTVTINNSTFSNNSALSGGAMRNNGTMTISNSTISGNTVGTGFGGGITNNSGRTLTINNSTISSNTAGANRGGGIRNDGTTNINRSIVSGNSAATSAAEISNNTSATINANNYNVFAHGLLTNAQAYNNFTPGANDRNTTSDGGSPVALASILNTTLANNGGPTLTHALVSGSPAVDFAPSAACTGSPINGVDQRGAARNYDGNGSVTGECDSGAYELREAILVGNCGGPELSGAQAFAFSSGNTLTVTVGTANGLNCITVEEMGADHLLATGNPNTHLHTGNWWYVFGNINSGFTVSITLPYASADDDSRVCKYPGGLGGFGWDCDPNNITYVANTSVTRSGITSFSDWAAGQLVGPTAVTLTSVTAHPSQMLTGGLLAASIALLGGLAALRTVRKQRN